MNKEEGPFILALDVSSIEKAVELVKEFEPYVKFFKIGLELIHTMFVSLTTPESFSEAIRNLQEIRSMFAYLRDKIFWDIKLNDIPNTVAGASRQIAQMGVKMFDVHASAGIKAIEQAVKNKGDALILVVTVLTSIGEEECISIFGESSENQVLAFAKMIVDAGADGIICSPKELELLAQHEKFDKLLKIIPCTRSKWMPRGDQSRVMTPGEAYKIAKNVLFVMGRQFISPPAEIGGRMEAVKKTSEEIQSS